MLPASLAIALAWFTLCAIMDRHYKVKGWRFNLITAALWPATAWLWVEYCQG